jgi:hypothetical protein
MPGAYRRQQRFPASRILHNMMNLHAEEPRFVQMAIPKRPRAFARPENP